MWFVLFKSLEGVDYYGNVPDVPDGPDPRVEEFDFNVNNDDWHLFLNDFILPVNDLCGSVLDFGDFDYFDANRCVVLKGWLEKRLVGEVPPVFKPIYEKLLEYASRAIELGTGVDAQT